jgi:hypothetical protein
MIGDFLFTVPFPLVEPGGRNQAASVIRGGFKTVKNPRILSGILYKIAPRKSPENK